jgi:outer membrane protein insertion porin family
MAILLQIRKLKFAARTLSWAVLACFLFHAPPLCAKEPKAKLKISGYGLFGDLELKRTILLLESGGKKRKTFDANFIEDASVIILSRLTDDGYLQPELTANVTLTNGQTRTFHWRQTFDATLPRPLEVTRVEFKINKGLFYFYGDIRFHGLETITEKTARSYFYENSALLPLKRYKVYSPQRFKRSVSNLEDLFDRQGYRDAKVTPDVITNEHTGAVAVSVKVEQGLRSIVRTVEQQIHREDSTNAQIIVAYLGAPYTTAWEQDFAQGIKTNLDHSGYPDTAVETSVVRKVTNNVIYFDLLAKVISGPKIKLGEVRYEGRKKTKVAVLDQRTKLTPGQLLDRIKVERARYRISQLGVFDSVGLHYTNIDERTRDAVFELKEGKELEASMLFSFGTYELLRVGFDIEQHNIWGRAHNARFRISQSFKTTQADYLYTIPQFIGEDVNAFFTASALRRQEIDFRREEYGGGIGIEKLFRRIHTDASTRFNYQ